MNLTKFFIPSIHQIRYAINAVLLQTKTVRKSLTWEQLKERKVDKLVYIELWRRKLNTPPALWSSISSSVAAIKRKQKHKRKMKKSVHEFNTMNNITQTDEKTLYRTSEAYVSIQEEIESEKNKAEIPSIFPLPLPLLRPSIARNRSLKPAPSPMYPTPHGRTPRYEDRAEEKGKGLDDVTALLLRDIECYCTFDDIIYFRTLAEKDLVATDEDGHRSWLFGFISW
jgi:hypothetical protein